MFARSFDSSRNALPDLLAENSGRWQSEHIYRGTLSCFGTTFIWAHCWNCVLEVETLSSYSFYMYLCNKIIILHNLQYTQGFLKWVHIYKMAHLGTNHYFYSNCYWYQVAGCCLAPLVTILNILTDFELFPKWVHINNMGSLRWNNHLCISDLQFGQVLTNFCRIILIFFLFYGEWKRRRKKFLPAD